MPIDWKVEISKMVYIKQVISDLDSNKIWPHYLPKVAASNNEIKKLEKKINKSLEHSYKEFLMHANGWQGFYQSVDLLGTNELIYGDKIAVAFELLKETDTKSSGVYVQDLLPIGLALNDIDLFCLDLKTGNIIWFAGVEIDRFTNFEDFFLTMLDYNREEIDDLQEEMKS